MQSAKHKEEESWKGIFSFLVDTMEAAVKSWHETSKVDGRVYFLLDMKTDTEKYAPVVNIDKVWNFLYQLLVTIFLLHVSCLFWCLWYISYHFWIRFTCLLLMCLWCQYILSLFLGFRIARDTWDLFIISQAVCSWFFLTSSMLDST